MPHNVDLVLVAKDAAGIASALVDAASAAVSRRQVAPGGTGGTPTRSDVAWAAMRRTAQRYGLDLIGARDGLTRLQRGALVRSQIAGRRSFGAVSPFELTVSGAWACTAIVVAGLLPHTAAAVALSDGRRFTSSQVGGAWVSNRGCPADLRWTETSVQPELPSAHRPDVGSASTDAILEARGAAALIAAVIDHDAPIATHAAGAPWHLAVPLLLANAGYTVAPRSNDRTTGPTDLLERFLSDLTTGRPTCTLDIAPAADVVIREREEQTR